MAIVVNADEMDDEIFMKHFEHRHSDQLGGLDGFLDSISDDTLKCYRTFHDRIHELLLGMEHRHEHE